MTWEQEMKEQAHFLAEEWAPVMAQELAQDLAKDLAKGMAKNMAKDMAKEIAEEKATEKSLETAKKLFALNLSAEQISQATDLPLAKILELKKEVQPIKV